MLKRACAVAEPAMGVRGRAVVEVERRLVWSGFLGLLAKRERRRAPQLRLLRSGPVGEEPERKGGARGLRLGARAGPRVRLCVEHGQEREAEERDPSEQRCARTA